MPHVQGTRTAMFWRSTWPGMVAALLLQVAAAASTGPWAHIQNWCFPTFNALPLSEEQAAHYARFDMVNLCSPGIYKDPATGVYATNVTETSREMAAEILARKPPPACCSAPRTASGCIIDVG